MLLTLTFVKSAALAPNVWQSEPGMRTPGKTEFFFSPGLGGYLAANKKINRWTG